MRRISLIILVHLAGFCYGQLSTADSALIGKNVHNIKLLNQDGDTVSLKEYQGKYLYVDFWFTQCKPCIAEFPFAKRLKNKMDEENMAFINVSFDISKSMWKESIKKFDITGENFLVSSFDNYNLLRNEFNVYFFPKFWVVSPEGNIINPSAGRPSDYVDNDLLKNEMDDVH